MSERSKFRIGSLAEQEAVEFLEAKDYKILERNYRTRMGEIDIVAMHHETICFIEVKARQSSDRGSALEAVTRQKQRQIIRLALYYLKEHNLRDPKVRFDVVAIDKIFDSKEQIKLLQNAFDASRA